MIKEALKKFFGEADKISRRSFKELITELYTTKTHEEIVLIHKKVKKNRADKNVLYKEKMIFKYLEQFEQLSFTRQEVEDILNSGEVKKFMYDKIKENTKKYKTDQHEHHKRKEIYDQVEEHVKSIIGDEL